MSKASYMQGRQQYQRPQGMLFADNSGTIVDGGYMPLGNEIGSDGFFEEAGSFIILSDDNREAISLTPQRIEQRQRMVNGRMRAYHVADKLKITTSWKMLPSRSMSLSPKFNADPTVISALGESVYTQKYIDPNAEPKFLNPYYGLAYAYTSDGGAGGVELLDWYENHTGSFWVYLSYDKYTNFEGTNNPYANVRKYGQVVEVFFSDFSYQVVKRSGSDFDYWDVSLTLEEV
jgi:hypothetical protein